MLSTRASDYVVALGYVNAYGGQDELVFDGASLVYDADGDLVASSPSFEEDMLVVDIDVDAVARERLHDPRMRKVAQPPACVRSADVRISTERAPRSDRLPARTSEPLDATAAVYGALVCGVRDYVRKNGFGEVFVALSGGIDSALTAAIAVDALGADAVTGVLMSSKYSSDHSRSDAFELAGRLGIGTLDIFKRASAVST
jgi:NAD+ synthase (glutamine-hydrolysing)